MYIRLSSVVGYNQFFTHGQITDSEIQLNRLAQMDKRYIHLYTNIYSKKNILTMNSPGCHKSEAVCRVLFGFQQYMNNR